MLVVAIEPLLHNIADVASAVGGLVAILALAAGARGVYRRTLGRRRDRYERLHRLGVGAQLSFFVSVIGEPPAIRRSVERTIYRIATRNHPLFDPALAGPDQNSHDVLVRATYVESIFVDRDFYVQTLTNDDESVLAFSVTTRSTRFAPTFEHPIRISHHARRGRWKEFGEPYVPLFKVRLGHTRFSDLDPQDLDEFAGAHFKASPGARLFAYSEFKYFGNPGHYLDFVFTASSTGVGPAAWDRLHDVVAEAKFYEWPYPSRPDPDDPVDVPTHAAPLWEELTAAHEFRRKTAISTITVVHPDLWIVNFPTTFGPHADRVRLLP